MIKKLLQLIIFSTILLGFLWAQKETVGFEYNYQIRDIDEYNNRSSIWQASYRYELSSDTRIGASAGVNYTKLFAQSNTNDFILKSANQLFFQLEVQQVIQLFYIKGAVQFYSIIGDAVEWNNTYSRTIHSNVYKIFEFPASIGLTYPVHDFDLYLGARKTYFYGVNDKDIYVKNSGTKTDIGPTVRETFQTELKIGLEATIFYHLSDAIQLECDFVKYAGDDFSIGLSIWGPLKRLR